MNIESLKSIEELPIMFREALSERVGSIDEIKKLSKRQIIAEKVGWELGDPSWFYTFEHWLNDAGLEIVEAKSSST